MASITVFGLGALGDGYVESQTATGELIVHGPFEMRIDIDALAGQTPGFVEKVKNAAVAGAQAVKNAVT